MHTQRIYLTTTDRKTITNNKKVSYRRQIARRRSCNRNFGHSRRVVDPVKIFLSSSLSTMQRLAVVSHAVCAYVGSPKNWGTLSLGPALGMKGVADHAAPYICYHAEFGRSRSDDTSLITQIHRKNLTARVTLFKTVKVIGTDTRTDQLMIRSNHGPISYRFQINGDFSRNSQFPTICHLTPMLRVSRGIL